MYARAVAVGANVIPHVLPRSLPLHLAYIYGVLNWERFNYFSLSLYVAGLCYCYVCFDVVVVVVVVPIVVFALTSQHERVELRN